jgi:hypothetical protein
MIKIRSEAGVSGKLTGSYLLDREGKLTPVYLHVPSTKWVGLGKEFLAPIDAEFLHKTQRISEDEAVSIVVYNALDFLKDSDSSEMGMTEMTKFKYLAEVGRFAPKARDWMMTYTAGKTVEQLKEMADSLPSFEAINSKWYIYLVQQFVKVAVYGNTIDFRISSDGFNWNKVIIDKVILNPTYGLRDKRFTISRESMNGYKTYFENATLDEILRYDKAILSSVKERRVVNNEVKYVCLD